ncbi:MAG: CheR family methyltransferase, partial [Candidatus Thorarchaeota archaeon]
MDLLIEELKKVTGMKFEHYQRNFLEKRIYYRMKHLNLEYYQEYIDYIRSNPDEIDLFLDKFTINYTYFFRNINVFESFEKFLKIYIKQLKRPLKIWSAPCATGDEPYSIAILLDHLKNLGNDFPDFEVVASDIDKTAIQIAKEGVYGDYAIHEVPITYLNKYFTKKNSEIGPKFIINQNLKEKVCFLQEDIIKGQNNNQKYDVIFCRNFIIYINQYAREKLMRVLKSRLHNGGLLILGGSETFSPHDSCFESISIRDRFYVKNFSSQRESFRREINNNFQNHKSKQLSDSTYKLKNQPNKMVLTRDEKKEKLVINKLISKSFSEKLKKISFKTHSSEKNLDKNQVKEARSNLLKSEKRKPTEVKFTELVVNMRANGDISKDKGKTALIKNTKHSNQSEISALDNNKLKLQVWEDDLKNRELLLDQREEIIEQRIINFERELGELEKRRKLAQKLFKNTREKEKMVIRKTQDLEQLRKKLEKREQALEQKERQLQNR